MKRASISEGRRMSASALNSALKNASFRKSYRNGRIINDQPQMLSDVTPNRDRRDTFGNLISSQKKHRIRIDEAVKVIEVENWKDQNIPFPSSSRCTICSVM